MKLLPPSPPHTHTHIHTSDKHRHFLEVLVFFPFHSQRTAAVKLIHPVALQEGCEDIRMAAAGFIFLASDISKE